MPKHSTLTGADLHEPKGVSAASANTLYVANGAGSGTWRGIAPADIGGLGSDGGVADLSVRSDGVGGLRFVNGHAHGAMTVTNNAVTFAITAVADTTFNTPAQYSLMTGASFPWAGEQLHDVTFSTDRLTVGVTGIYMINLWANISAYPSSSARISIRYRVNGSSFSSRKPTVKAGGVGAVDQLSGFGLLSLTAGDYIQLVVASDATGNLTFSDINSSLTLVRPT